MSIEKGKHLMIHRSLRGLEIKACEQRAQSYKKHLHKELSIGLIESGSTQVDFNGTVYTFEKGDLIVIPPYLSHLCSPEDIDLWRFVMIYIDPKFYEEKLSFSKVCKVQGQVAKAFRRKVDALMEVTDDGSKEALLIDLLDDLYCESHQEDLFTFQPHEAEEMNALKDYIEAHYQEDFSLEDLEGLFHLNKYTLIRHFKAVFNTTPNAYRLQLRVTEGKKRLEGGEDVLSISHEVGFYDQAHFIREFKKMYGMSPLDYLNHSQ